MKIKQALLYTTLILLRSTLTNAAEGAHEEDGAARRRPVAAAAAAAAAASSGAATRCSNSIFEAIDRGDLDAVKAAIAANGNSLEGMVADGRTPLRRAISKMQWGLAEYFLRSGLNVKINYEDSFGQTAIYSLMNRMLVYIDAKDDEELSRSIEIFRLFLSYKGIDPFCLRTTGQSLHFISDRDARLAKIHEEGLAFFYELQKQRGSNRYYDSEAGFGLASESVITRANARVAEEKAIHEGYQRQINAQIQREREATLKEQKARAVKNRAADRVEAARVALEAARVEAEAARADLETARVVAEAARIDSAHTADRVGAEIKAIDAERMGREADRERARKAVKDRVIKEARADIARAAAEARAAAARRAEAEYKARESGRYRTT